MHRYATALTVFLLVIGCSTTAQIPDNLRTISINMSATESVPADLIIFNVNINAEGATPQKAFDLHKQRETVLADLLKSFDIEEDEINYQPIRISKQSRNRDRDQYSVTSQQVSVTFSDFEIYEDIQLRLIENDFDSFSANFSSTELEEGKDRALSAAIESAKERAEFIASAMGVNVVQVKTIHYSDHVIGNYRSSSDAMMMRAESSSSMMDFAQTVNVRASINVTFELANRSN